MKNDRVTSVITEHSSGYKKLSSHLQRRQFRAPQICEDPEDSGISFLKRGLFWESEQMRAEAKTGEGGSIGRWPDGRNFQIFTDPRD